MKPGERVLGWDFLRGLCAVAVAVYHLLTWQGVSDIHTWGSYGVYIFFILSGASLAYTYADLIAEKAFSFRKFLWLRYWRLAPLYLALMLIVLPWKLTKEGATTDLLLVYATNATFSFGFLNPSTHSALIGGWSLGIEAVFYLLFPLFMLTFRKKGFSALLFCMLILLQAGWIYETIGTADYLAAAELYHHAPAFAAYFMGGCIIGFNRRQKTAGKGLSVPLFLVFMAAGFAALLAANPASAGQELVGLRGAVLPLICFLLVYAAGLPDLARRMAAGSRYLGDSTYGVYLLHPVIFFGLVYFVFPKLGVSQPTQWGLSGQLMLVVAVVASAFALALASEYFFEKPIRTWSRNRAKTRRLRAGS